MSAVSFVGLICTLGDRGADFFCLLTEGQVMAIAEERFKFEDDENKVPVVDFLTISSSNIMNIIGNFDICKKLYEDQGLKLPGQPNPRRPPTTIRPIINPATGHPRCEVPAVEDDDAASSSRPPYNNGDEPFSYCQIIEWLTARDLSIRRNTTATSLPWGRVHAQWFGKYWVNSTYADRHNRNQLWRFGTFMHHLLTNGIQFIEGEVRPEHIPAIDSFYPGNESLVIQNTRTEERELRLSNQVQNALKTVDRPGMQRIDESTRYIARRDLMGPFEDRPTKYANYPAERILHRIHRQQLGIKDPVPTNVTELERLIVGCVTELGRGGLQGLFGAFVDQYGLSEMMLRTGKKLLTDALSSGNTALVEEIIATPVGHELLTAEHALFDQVLERYIRPKSVGENQYRSLYETFFETMRTIRPDFDLVDLDGQGLTAAQLIQSHDSLESLLSATVLASEPTVTIDEVSDEVSRDAYHYTALKTRVDHTVTFESLTD